MLLSAAHRAIESRGMIVNSLYYLYKTKLLLCFQCDEIDLATNNLRFNNLSE